MAILWAGSEDIDFPNGSIPSITTSTSGPYFRTAYARCAIGSPGPVATFKSSTFSPVTSAWASCRYYFPIDAGPSGWCYSLVFGKSGTNSCLGVANTTSGNAGYPTNKIILIKLDNGTQTVVATEAGASRVGLNRYDLQILNYGSSGTVNIWVDGVLVISYTGNLSLSGVSNFDQVWFAQLGGGSPICWASEFIVANEDTRNFAALATLALTGAGTTDQWSGGPYSAINGITMSDASPIYTNSTAQDEQFNITDMPPGTFTIRAMKIAARSAMNPGSTPTKVALGYNSGGTVAVGTAQTVANGYNIYEQLDQINPITGVPFQQAEMNALQLNVRSA